MSKFRSRKDRDSELVRCKDCIHRQTDKCPMYHEEWHTVDKGDGYWDDDLVIFDWTIDDGYCHLGDTEKGESHETD